MDYAGWNENKLSLEHFRLYHGQVSYYCIQLYVDNGGIIGYIA